MDNLTHSLFGAAAAETYIQSRFKNKVDRNSRVLLYATSILANNLPDIDLLFGLIDSTRLGYLLNHRGWTHTVLGTLPLALIFLLLAQWFLKEKRLTKDIFLLALLGGQTHMLLDGFNSYGVHPFWPLSANWFYMDSIFIIEPLLWISLLPVWLKSRRLSLFLTGLIISVYTFGWSRSLVTLPYIGLSLFSLVVLYLVVRKMPDQRRAPLAMILFLMIVAGFFAHQLWAQRKVENYFADVKPQAQLLDTVLVPLPSNPTRWFFLAPFIENSQYQILAGSLNLYGLTDTTNPWPADKTTTPVSRPLPPTAPHFIAFRGVWMPSHEELLEGLQRCDVRAWFKFARVPYWKDGEFTDLRFALRNRDNFTILQTQGDDVCPPVPAPWTPPRQDLLNFFKSLTNLAP